MRLHCRSTVRTVVAVPTVLTALAAGLSGTAGPAGARPVAAPTATSQVVVAPWGRDTWPGTLARPFATLERARDRARWLIAHRAGDVVVSLRAGTYWRTTPLTLGPSDGGNGARRVVYQSFGHGTPHAERAVISGGRPVPRWRSVGGVWQADVGDLRTRQLYVDGRSARRAALPGGLPGRVRMTSSGYVTDSVAPQRWSHPERIELVYTGAFFYAEPRCGVASITGTATSSTITMRQPCFRWAQAMYRQLEPRLIDPTRVENSASFLSPGTWYLDESPPGHHLLKYQPERDQRLTDTRILVPAASSLLDVRGAGNLTIRGIGFAHTTWLDPDTPTGFLHTYGDSYAVGPPVEDPGGGDSEPAPADTRTMPAAVRFARTTGLRFESNTITQTGASGLAVTDSHGARIVGNTVRDVAGGGISAGVLAPATAGSNGDLVIEGNHLRDIGVDYGGGIGVAVNDVPGTAIRHNEIRRSAYSAIVVADGATARDVQVVGNLVERPVQTLPDGGGIYLVGAQGRSFGSGALVAGNLITGVRNPLIDSPEAPFPNALYFDVNADHITARSNVVIGGQHAVGGVEPRRIRLVTNFWDAVRPGWEPPQSASAVSESGTTVLPVGRAWPACRRNPACAAIAAHAG